MKLMVLIVICKKEERVVENIYKLHGQIVTSCLNENIESDLFPHCEGMRCF